MNRNKLFCLTHAGGSASVFKEWSHACPPIDIIPIEYSGRGRRISENILTNINDMVNDVYEQIFSRINESENYSIFGHSFGGLLTFELIRKFDSFVPKHVFISGMDAPHKRKTPPPFHLLPDDQFIERIQIMNGTPSEVLKNKELMDIFLPILRADFKINNEYQYDLGSNKINRNISIIFGDKDHIDIENIHFWKEVTDGVCDFFEINGDHFYINKNYGDALNIISQKLSHV
ncbi:thioesterase II family protein [Bacillus toyonensis]|uniref:thioesterase II family protein n=1 Tax=Bacillus toyonensis TaxID=155322 RepID=UPI000BF3F385|nr:thioesterase domain-containing protein [Bacillus toyonensis]PGD12322.1 oleoyl-ACP hydrolase [Bacillus toyonensis]